ncbi:MAG: hypothetical protein ACOC46_01225, partial [Pirellulales bacterium]
MPVHRFLTVMGILGLLLLVASPASRAQRGQERATRLDEIRLAEAVEEFLATLARGEVDDAFQQILRGSPVADETEQVEHLVTQTENALRAYGAFRGSERLDIRSIGQSLVFLRYLYKTERLPLVWFFAYYRPDAQAEWNLVVIRFDTDLRNALSRGGLPVAKATRVGQGGGKAAHRVHLRV